MHVLHNKQQVDYECTQMTLDIITLDINKLNNIFPMHTKLLQPIISNIQMCCTNSHFKSYLYFDE